MFEKIKRPRMNPSRTESKQTYSTTDCHRLRGRDSSPSAAPAAASAADQGRRLEEEGGAIGEEAEESNGRVRGEAKI